MKTFRDYLTEAEANQGVYAAIIPNPASAQKIFTFAQSFNIEDPKANFLGPKDYHTTVMYSTNPVIGVKNGESKISVLAKTKQFRILTRGVRTVVLELDCPDAAKIFKDFVAKGATWDFDEFIPHVSICYNTTLEEAALPKITKQLEIHFDKLKIEPLNPNFGEK